MKYTVIRSYAKINIGLFITGKRENGYHDLDMIMVPIELHDTIWLSELKNAVDNFVTMDDFSNGLIGDNAVTSALNRFQEYYKFDNKFKIDIHKVTPIKAGLGGGSSNAAFALTGVNKYLKLNVPDEALMNLALPLGSDIPFFIKCQPSRCKGLGEKLEPITIKNDYYVLIIKPHTGCSTVEVYKKYDELNVKSDCNINDIVKALETGDDDLLEKSMFNVLEEPAFTLVPEIKEIKEQLKNEGLRLVMMTGSGSAVFALSQNKRLIKSIAKKYEDNYEVIVTRIMK